MLGLTERGPSHEMWTKWQRQQWQVSHRGVTKLCGGNFSQSNSKCYVVYLKTSLTLIMQVWIINVFLYKMNNVILSLTLVCEWCFLLSLVLFLVHDVYLQNHQINHQKDHHRQRSGRRYPQHQSLYHLPVKSNPLLNWEFLLVVKSYIPFSCKHNTKFLSLWDFIVSLIAVARQIFMSVQNYIKYQCCIPYTTKLTCTPFKPWRS